MKYNLETARKLLSLVAPLVLFSVVNSPAQSILDSNKVDIKNDSLGYLSVKTDVDSFYVVINDNFDNVLHITGEDTLIVKSGKQQIRIIKKYYRDLVTNITIKPDTVNALRTNLLPFRNFKYYKYHSSYPRIYWQAPVIIKSDPDAMLYADDKYIGKGTGRVDTTGYIRVRSVLPSGKSKTETFYAEEDKRQTFFVREIYHRPEKKKSRYLALIPGASQIYQGDKLKGYTILGASLIGAGILLKYQNDFSTKYSQFKQTQSQYKTSSNAIETLRLGDLAEKQLSSANKIAQKRNLLIYATTAVYLYSAIDAFLKPKNGYRSKINFDPYIDFKYSGSTYKGVSLTYKF